MKYALILFLGKTRSQNGKGGEFLAMLLRASFDGFGTGNQSTATLNPWSSK